MGSQNEEANDPIENMDQVDPWQAAFDALNIEQAGNAEMVANREGTDNGDPARGEGIMDGAVSPDRDEGAIDDETGFNTGIQGESGGSDNVGGEDVETDASIETDGFGITEDDIKSFNDSIVEQATESAIRDVAQAFIKKGIRHRNGKLGANIDDPDICKRDEDGVPVFYNPDTGREFTGDNPRRQAKEWVDDYNAELAHAFNQACQQYINKVVEIEKPRMEVLRFAPTYDKLDPIRRDMLDSIIEDYEVKDTDGQVIGYSCDLDKALAAVNRQVAMVQKHASKTPAEPTVQGNASAKKKGPALDIKSSSSAAPKEKPDFKNLAEAMEWEQDQIIAKQKKGN